jgi:pSer/pThr/pTyr-binding forkhead associated (FHA) protein
MELYLEVMSGDALGKKFKVADGLKIGRKDCDILLGDPKVSSHHANIVSRGGQRYFIQDQKSSNGIKFNGLKVPELLLAPGVEFRLGNTVLRVIDLAPPAVKVSPKAAVEPDTPLPVTPPKSSPKPAKAEKPPPLSVEPPEIKESEPIEVEMPQTWRTVLLNLIQNAGLRAQNVLNDEIKAFQPPLKLVCQRGQDLGKTWVFGYGPRQVGEKSIDLALKEPGVPPICFEVRPHVSGAEFKTDYPKIVKLNGQERSHDILKAGDVIEILSTQLMVDFHET